MEFAPYGAGKGGPPRSPTCVGDACLLGPSSSAQADDRPQATRRDFCGL